MAEKVKKVHHREPFIHLAKRDDMVPWKMWLIRVATILVGFFAVGLISTVLTGEALGDVYETMFRGVFGRLLEGKTSLLWMYLQRTAILLCLSLAVTPAFKMKFWNCGAEGQALMGGLAAMVCMIHLGGKLPEPALLFVVVATSIAVGALWGFIPAVFKAHYNTNETLFTLMMNYVATQIVSYYVYLVGQGSGVIQPVSTGALPIFGENEYLLNILIVVVAMILMFIYLKYSKQGYEIAVVGESQNTARYIGINVKKVIMRTMLISGAVCGLAGLLLVSGIDHSVNANTVGGQGFTAIMVSWLGQFNPFIIALMSALVTFLKMGIGKVAEASFLDKSFADVASGIVILLLVSCEFFIRYSVKFRHTKTKKEGTE